jgi:hypothetical protein
LSSEELWCPSTLLLTEKCGTQMVFHFETLFVHLLISALCHELMVSRGCMNSSMSEIEFVTLL